MGRRAAAKSPECEDSHMGFAEQADAKNTAERSSL